MQDTYYQRSEVSNSDLTELKNLLYPRTQYGDKEKAFKFGSLIDAMITEPERVRYDKHMVDDVLYSGEDWELAEAMKKSLRMEARHDPFLAQVLAKAETQRFMVNKNQCFQYGNFKYTLDTDIAGSRQDFIYGISKKNQKVFKAFIKRGDTIYQKGKEKYEELAFRWWMLFG